MSSKDIAVSVRGLSKAYHIAQNASGATTLREALLHRMRHPFAGSQKKTFWALQDVDFDIQQGDVVGIIGRNGAGKSTLLKILSNITRPTSGHVELFGRVGSLLEVGTGFHLELTGRENIFLNGAILGMRKREIQQQFDAIVDFSGVEQFLDTPVKRYSSGMFVRLAFAVAAHLNPDILIVDEVLAVGDAEFQQKCLGKMQDVSSEQGRTVLFVSHNEAAVRRLCKSAIFLKSGHVEFTGTPGDAFARYRADRSESGFDASNRRASSGIATIHNAFMSVDGVPTTEFTSNNSVVVNLEIEVTQDVSFYPEFLLRDGNSLPIMFAPLALAQKIEYKLSPGFYELAYELLLPPIAAGRYMMDLGLAEFNVCFHDSIEQALTFAVSPSTNPLSGWVFEQSNGQSCLVLEVREVKAERVGTPRTNAPSAEHETEVAR